MRIGVMAAGAVGAYFGGRLAAAGHEVAFLARGAHLAALRHNGLILKSTAGDLHLPKINATDDPKAVGPVDIVLFAVKLWDTEIAGEQTRPLVGPNTRVLTLQNGVDTIDRLRPILGDTVIGCSAQIASTISAPGEISHTSPFAILRCGREGNKPDPALAAFVDTAKAAGVDITLVPDIEVELWKKFTFLVGLAGMTTATRLPIGGWRTDPDARAMYLAAMKEVMAVARAKGIVVPDGYAEDRLAATDKNPPGFRASMSIDLDRGNRLELDWLTGHVVALGRELGVPVPVNAAIYTLLKPYRMGKPTVA